MLEISLMGEQVRLLPEKAMYWEAKKSLIVSDLHWGKSAHFRKHGIAIPNQTQTGDEIRLASLIRRHRPERLIIAGDLFHSKSNQQVEVFSHFRQAHQSLHIDLVVGNHDILPRETYDAFRLEFHSECLTEGPFCFAHDMIPGKEQFVIHGHVHPALKIKSPGYNQPALKLCCFAEDRDRMILPAFGEFTGTHVLEAAHFRHLYLVAEQNVIQWK
ncbi:MAG: ligase-associated DNA damage response endonuclease PdeM [Sphingobacteriales bacterium]|nr:MAG: ligase-associated DNA damage response endonuclease PdeM [Sphingobacteriales bacterium]